MGWDGIVAANPDECNAIRGSKLKTLQVRTPVTRVMGSAGRLWVCCRYRIYDRIDFGLVKRMRWVRSHRAFLKANIAVLSASWGSSTSHTK